MTQVPSNAPMSARIGSVINPEVFASIVAVPVVIIAGLVFLSAPALGQPGAAVVPPAATPTPSPASTASASTTPTQTATTTSRPDTAKARVVLQLVDQLLTNR